MRKLLSIVTLVAATALGVVGTAGIASADEAGAEATWEDALLTQAEGDYYINLELQFTSSHPIHT
jgi:hypothetical protein